MSLLGMGTVQCSNVFVGIVYQCLLYLTRADVAYPSIGSTGNTVH